jgi:hypothetical protein
VIKHVSLLVRRTSLDRGALAEHVAHGGAQRLGAIDHDQHALLDI